MYFYLKRKSLLLSYTFYPTEVASDHLKNTNRNLNEEKMSEIKLQMPVLNSEMCHLQPNNENLTKLDNSSTEFAVKGKYSLFFFRLF